MWIKVGGVWNKGRPWIKVNGVWKRASAVWTKVAGVWERMGFFFLRYAQVSSSESLKATRDSYGRINYTTGLYYGESVAGLSDKDVDRGLRFYWRYSPGSGSSAASVLYNASLGFKDEASRTKYLEDNGLAKGVEAPFNLEGMTIGGSRGIPLKDFGPFTVTLKMNSVSKGARAAAVGEAATPTFDINFTGRAMYRDPPFDFAKGVYKHIGRYDNYYKNMRLSVGGL